MPDAAGVTPQQWRVLTDSIFPSAKSAEAVLLAMDYCAARKLDVFKRPVHIVPMWNSSLRREVETVWPGISELQITAARTGQWAGMDEPKWGPVKKRTFKGMVGKDDRQREDTIELEYPEWCSVTVYRMLGGARHAFCEPVYWEEAYARQGRTEVPNEMWQKRTRGQLHKVAKAASLRAAFPEEAGNDYVAEEMHGKEIDSGGITIDHEPAASTLRDQINAETPLVDEPPPRPKGRTAREYLAELHQRMVDAEDQAVVNAIIAEPGTQRAMATFQNGAKAELDGIIAYGIGRFGREPVITDYLDDGTPIEGKDWLPPDEASAEENRQVTIAIQRMQRDSRQLLEQTNALAGHQTWLRSLPQAEYDRYARALEARYAALAAAQREPVG
jgi:phage recombination protein Bet